MKSGQRYNNSHNSPVPLQIRDEHFVSPTSFVRIRFPKITLFLSACNFTA